MAYTIPLDWNVDDAVPSAKLTILSSDLTFFGTPPAGQASSGATTQSVTSGTTTQITTMSSVFVGGSMTWGSNELTVPVAGVYYVKATVRYAFAGNPSVYYQSILKQNSSVIATGSRLSYNNLASLTIPLRRLVTCAASDTLSLFTLHNSGSAKNASGIIFAKWISS
jgi:hypothetical protein